MPFFNNLLKKILFYNYISFYYRIQDIDKLNEISNYSRTAGCNSESADLNVYVLSN